MQREQTRTSVDQLVNLVHRWSVETPASVAVDHDGDALTYAELREQSTRLASVLRARGVGAGSRVALALPRSPRLIVAALAVLHAGGAYVPVDPAYPMDRQKYMLADAGAEALINDGGAPLPGGPDTVDVASAGDKTLPLDAPTAVPGNALAYVIYTSGSSGAPKGVAVPRDGVCQLVLADPRIAVRPAERVAHLAPTAFDASTFEIWAPLCRGGTAVVLDDSRLSATELGAWLRRSSLDWLFLTSGLFHMLAEHDLDALRHVGTVITGGDILSPHRVTAAAAVVGKRLYAAYGPTETTVFTSLHEAAADHDPARVPLGTALVGKEMRVLDRRLCRVPEGEIGEIYVTGAGLAHGYHGRPGLTSERFVADPEAGRPGGRMYRTGDRGRVLPNGEFEFQGRADRQVKVRGFRVELGEIEATLHAHEAVGAAAVTVVSDPFGKRIVAYVSAASGQLLEPIELRQWLASRLPAYLRPNNYVLLDRLPLDPNGKVLRSELPAPWSTRAAASSYLPPYAAPRTDLESEIANVFEDVLSIDRVGRHDDFFVLGGDSLRSVQAVTSLRAIGAKISARDFFGGSTVAQIAAHVQ